MVEFINSHSSPFRQPEEASNYPFNTNNYATLSSFSSIPSPSQFFNSPAAVTVASMSMVPPSTAPTSLVNGVNWRVPFIYADIVSSLLALVGNLLIVAAVVRTKFALAGYRRFLLSLAIADIFMASTTVLTFCHEKMAGRYKWQLIETCGNNFLRSLTLVGYFASLLSIGGLTADNFLGIFRPLSYNALMGGGRLVRAIAALWVLSLLLGFIDLPITIAFFLYQSNKKQAVPVTKPTPTSLFFQFTKALENDSTMYSTSASSPLPSFTINPLLRYSAANTASIRNTKISSFPPLYRSTKSRRSADDFDSALLITSSSTPAGINDEFPLDLHGLIHDVLELIEEEQESTDWCTYYASNKFGVEFFVIGLTVPCFLLLLVIYGRIFVEVLRRRSSRQRKTFRLVLTTLLLIFSFTFCWMPFIIFELFMYVRTSRNSDGSGSASGGSSASAQSSSSASASGDGDGPQKPSYASNSNQALLVNTVFNSLLMLSPLLNPIIYSTRLRRVRMQVLAILTCNSRKWAEKCSQKHHEEATINQNHYHLNAVQHHGALGQTPSRNPSNNDCTSSSRSLNCHNSLRLTRSTNSSTYWAASSTMSPPDTPRNALISPSPSALFPPNPSFGFCGANNNNSSSNFTYKMSPSVSFSNGSAVFTGCAAVANMKPDFRCHVRGCDSLFLSQAAFFRHITSKHGDIVKVCDRCFEIFYREQGHVCSPRDEEPQPAQKSQPSITLQPPPPKISLPVTPMKSVNFKEKDGESVDNKTRNNSSSSSSSSNRSSFLMPNPFSMPGRSRSFLVEDRKVSESELNQLNQRQKAASFRRSSCGAVERRKRSQAKKERKRRRRLTITGVVLTALEEEDSTINVNEDDDDDDETSYENVSAALNVKTLNSAVFTRV